MSPATQSKIVFGFTIPQLRSLEKGTLCSIWLNPKCLVFVDKQCLWRELLTVKRAAIKIMFVSYYMFNIQYLRELAVTQSFAVVKVIFENQTIFYKIFQRQRQVLK
ncbi:Hypothetical protein CINCED_3A022325 [Cinara cedri]|uniref:Uncharacterized protein n=1 Tax=Cinara cedri TaxID=506608 RepID=A0A5E4NTN1_9HEMI|nr:Hypothetical protein CINCED_3A022325 [Cinara cedri]